MNRPTEEQITAALQDLMRRYSIPEGPGDVPPGEPLRYVNRACGDQVEIYPVELNGGVAFPVAAIVSRGCSLLRGATAVARMLLPVLPGELEARKALLESILAYLQGTEHSLESAACTLPDAALQELETLALLQFRQARLRCATLPFEALRALTGG